MNIFLLWIHTLRRLKWEQWWIRGWHPIKRMFYVAPKKCSAKYVAAALQFSCHGTSDFTVNHYVKPQQGNFTFLNVSHHFANATIDWNILDHGLLWNYQLNYLDYLEDETLPLDVRLKLLEDYQVSYPKNIIGKASYPTSRRLLNCIRFLGKNQNATVEIIYFLYQDTKRLEAFPERHLLGNHLWENACAMISAGLFFKHEKFLKTGELWLRRCIKEQILADGGHYEQSPGYHVLAVSKLLQCLLLNADAKLQMDKLFTLKLREICADMIAWLREICFADNSLPAFNDVPPEHLQGLKQLEQIADLLGIEKVNKTLSTSGYRRMLSGKWEVLIDVANVMATHQPGHSHADTFTFCLRANGKPVIIDTGTSTYLDGEIRSKERSTAAHNTLSIDTANSAEIWKSFRMGYSATVKILEEGNGKLMATHDGFKSLGLIHERTWEFIKGNLRITDRLTGKKQKGKLHLHLPYAIETIQVEGTFLYCGTIKIRIENALAIVLQPCEVAMGFNKLSYGTQIEAIFETEISTIFY